MEFIQGFAAGIVFDGGGVLLLDFEAADAKDARFEGEDASVPDAIADRRCI